MNYTYSTISPFFHTVDLGVTTNYTYSTISPLFPPVVSDAIPLVAGVCFSVPALIWAFYVFYTLHKHGARISPLVILLIINDLAELFLSVIIASYVIDSHVNYPVKGVLSLLFESNLKLNLLITFRVAGLYLHQLVALKTILSLRRQLCSGPVFSPLCSIIFYIILWALAFGCQFLNIWLNLLFISLPCCILAITWVLTCKASSLPVHIKPHSAVLIVSTFTLIVSFTTAGIMFAFEIYNGHFRQRSQFSAFFISLRVISDPLLCVLVCKEQLKVHKQQTHTDMNTDQRSV